MSAEFCDTNVLVYAFDRMAGRKRERARELLERLWRTNNGVLSVQVLQELFVTLTRKVARPLSAHQARAVKRATEDGTAPFERPPALRAIGRVLAVAACSFGFPAGRDDQPHRTQLPTRVSRGREGLRACAQRAIPWSRFIQPGPTQPQSHDAEAAHADRLAVLDLPDQVPPTLGDRDLPCVGDCPSEQLE